MVGLFAKPLFEAMAEQNKSLQSGAAICMGKMVDSATEPPVAAFQKLCPRISKLLNSPNYLTKASLLPVVGSLSQVCLRNVANLLSASLNVFMCSTATWSLVFATCVWNWDWLLCVNKYAESFGILVNVI